jgi:hypothetical protein
MHISYGSPEEVAGQLGADRMLPLATDLIVQFSPAAPPLREAITGLELLAPRWRRARPRTRGLCHWPPVMARQIGY